MPNLNPYLIRAYNVVDEEGNKVETTAKIVPADKSNANWKIENRGLYFPTKADVTNYFEKRFDEVKEDEI